MNMLFKVNGPTPKNECDAVANIQIISEVNDLSEGIMSDFLKATLETNLPKAGKKKAITLGVWENKLAGSIKAEFPFQFETAESSQVTADLLRGEHVSQTFKLTSANKPPRYPPARKADETTFAW